jgi:hypothetical protein
VTANGHLSKHDREIAAIRTLIKVGMQMLSRNQQQINELVRAQRRTEASLNKLTGEVRELTAQMRRGVTNGHTKRKVDIQ